MFSLKLPRPLYDRLAEAAEADRRSMAFIVKDALEEYFATHLITHETGNSSHNTAEVGSLG